MLYKIEWLEVEGVLKVGFGDEASTNDKIVVEAVNKIQAMLDELQGKVLKINGAISVPVALS